MGDPSAIHQSPFFFHFLSSFRMNENDKRFFPSDVRKYDWNSYAYNYNMGLLRYIGNDTLEDFDAARRRMRKFRIAHYFVLAIYYSFLALIYYGLGRLFGINNILSNWYDRLMDLVD